MTIHAEGLDFASEALRLASDLGDQPLIVSARIRRGGKYCFIGRIREGIAEMQSALDSYEGDEADLLPATSQLTPSGFIGIWLSNSGQFDVALKKWEQERPNLGDRELSWRQQAARAYAMMGSIEKARHEFEEYRRRAELAGEDLGVATVMLSRYFYVHAPFEADDLDAREDLRSDRIKWVRRSEGIARGGQPYPDLDIFTVDWNFWLEELQEMTHFGNAFWAQHARGLLASLSRYRGDRRTASQQVDMHFIPMGQGRSLAIALSSQVPQLQRTAAALCLDEE